MTRSQRRKDVIAAVVIVGTAILYWTSGGRPDMVLDEHRASGDRSERPSKVSELPGIGTGRGD